MEAALGAPLLFRKALEALRKGAARTAAAIGGSLRSLLHGRDLDDALIDQIETALVVRPLQLLAGVAAAFDRFVIDGLVDAVGRVPVAVGALVRRSQSGLLQRYAVGGALGALLLVAALWWRLVS